MRQNHINKTVLRALILLSVPISVLVYNYAVSKLHTFRETELASFMVLFLLFYSIWIFIKNRAFLNVREVKIALLFFLFSLPAYFMSDFGVLESYLRYFALIAFVPLGFSTGMFWGRQAQFYEKNKRDRLLSALIIPAIVALIIILNSDITINDDVSRDYIFSIVIFTPFALYYNKNIWPILFLAIVLYVCIISAKRSGVLCVASVIPFYVIIKTFAQKGKFLHSLLIMVISLGFVFITYRFLPNINAQLEYTIERLNNMNDLSNETRVLMYERTWTEIKQADAVHLLFGHGCLSTIEIFGNPTHNDWLEIAYDYGIIPFFCFVSLFFSLSFRIVKTIKKNLSASLVMMSTLLAFLISTIGNCMFANHWAVFVLLFTLGFALSNLENPSHNHLYS